LTKKLKKDTFKFHYNIIVKEFEPLLFLLNKLDGKLVAKQKQLVTMKTYLHLKKENRHYTEATYDIVDQLKQLNTNY